MLLKGSCHCGAVGFTVGTHTPYPYLRCYCSICRKTAGGGGYAINIMGETKTLAVSGRKNISVYRARMRDEKGGKTISPGRRHFCKKCGSALWIHDPRWAKWIYPFASAIDTPLPVAPQSQHILLAFKPGWVAVPKRRRDKYFREFPAEAILDWHRRRGLVSK
ncbi:MAG: GFA family protein [Burkholderiales bacterium]